MINRLFCDIETSGLNVLTSVPLEIGMMLDKTSDGPDDEPATFVMLVRPTDAQWDLASKEALTVNGITRERCDAEGKPLQEVGDELCAWLVEHGGDEGVMYIGQNPLFDLRFLDHYFGPKLTFVGINFGKPVDVIDMAKQLARVDKSVRFSSFKGSAISEALGLPPEPALHTAFGGLLAVRQNYYALAGRLTKLSS